MKTRIEILENRTKSINGNDVKSMIDNGNLVQTQECCVFNQDRMFRIDEERGGVFVWAPESKRYFLIAKRK